jgi:hypothetical protein
LELKLRAWTEGSYEKGNQLESVNVALGPETEKKVIKLLTASGGKG